MATTTRALERFETAFAVLYRNDARVYKLRKPLAVWAGGSSRDLRSLEARRAACEREAQLNETLSPEVDSRLVPVVRDADATLCFLDTEDEARDHGGAVVDWALSMVRLDDRARADRRLAEGSLDEACLKNVAHRIALLHERAREEGGGTRRDPVDRLYDQIGLRLVAGDSEAPAPPLPAELARIEAWQHNFLETHVDRFRRRAERDSLRVGHGELGLDHVFVKPDGDVHILAGLEMMGEGSRETDRVADVALLVSDLAARRRVDLAERFLAIYARMINDFDLYPLIDFYASLRATQRGKLEWFAAQLYEASPDEDRAAAERARSRAREFFKLALAARQRPLLPPTVVAMGGQVASGKSTVARHIARRIGAPVVSSDATRDYLLGERLNEDLHEVRWERAYEAGFGTRVYDEVMRRAGEVLTSGRPVVIDGCFRSREQRAAARALAERFGHPFHFVEANVSREVQRERLMERAERDDVELEVWTDIADDLRADWQAADELPREEYLRLDTDQPLEENADRIEQRLATWPKDLPG